MQKKKKKDIYINNYNNYNYDCNKQKPRTIYRKLRRVVQRRVFFIEFWECLTVRDTIEWPPLRYQLIKHVYVCFYYSSIVFWVLTELCTKKCIVDTEVFKKKSLLNNTFTIFFTCGQWQNKVYQRSQRKTKTKKH